MVSLGRPRQEYEVRILELHELTCQPEVGSPQNERFGVTRSYMGSTSQLSGVMTGIGLAVSSKSSRFRQAWASFHGQPSLMYRNIVSNEH